MIVSSQPPGGPHPLYRGLVRLLLLVGLMALLGLWAACTAWQQGTDAVGLVREQRLAVLLMVQGLCTVLIVVGLVLIGHRAYHVLVRRTHEALSRLPPGAFERGQDELQRLVEALQERHAQASGLAAADRWQVRLRDEQARRSSLALQTLHQAVRLLAQGEISEFRLRQALHLLEATLDAQTVALRLDAGVRDALGGMSVLASRHEPRLLAGLSGLPPATRDSGARILAPGEHGPQGGLLVPLARDGMPIGTLLAEFGEAVRLDESQVQLAESFGRLATLALTSVSRRQEERRRVLLEERGAIAAELHDSLAQALSYMKIQVARLQTGLDRGDPPATVQHTVDELREGLAAAYREVRELISAFRLRIGPGGLRAALQAAIDGFNERSALSIHYSDRIAPCRLEPSEELHVLQLVREAVLNAMRHAEAEHVWVCAAYRPDEHLFTVTVEDDGLGLEDRAGQAGHHGLEIMLQRARALQGHCAIEARTPRGTRVHLSFAPQRFPGDAAPTPSPP